jgi:hypothetical protein
MRAMFGLLICIPMIAAAQRTAGPPGPAQSAPPSIAGLQTFEIASAILGETRTIHVALPASHDRSPAGRRYPVVVVVDGEELTAVVKPVSEHLSRMGQIPESIIVGIENTNRLRDLTPPGLSVSGSGLNEGGDKFIDFIERELLPEVDRRFRGAGPRTFIGHSSGGILGTYIAATRPSFATVIAIDTPMHLGDFWLEDKLRARIGSRGGSSLRYVSIETRFGWKDERWNAFASAAPKTWGLYRQKLEHENHESMAMLASYIGLREAFRDYSMQVAPVSPTTSILPHYAKVSESLGERIFPPRRLMMNVVEDLLMEGRGSLARSAFDTLVLAYGSPSNSADLLAQIAEVEKRPPPKETVESLLATPFSTPDEARPFVGDWVGDHWMNPEEPRTGRQTLRIRIENGKVVGETITRTPDGEEMTQKWTYFRVTPKGFTFGFMNGMRPRGMLMHFAEVDNDSLKGESTFGGIDFVRPDGRRPPPIHFAFKRVSP